MKNTELIQGLRDLLAFVQSNQDFEFAPGGVDPVKMDFPTWYIPHEGLPRDFITKVYNERNAKAAELFAKLPGFDIEAALAGAPYVHRFDLPKVHPYHDVRRIAEPHGGLLVWVGDWVTYDSTDSGLEELESQLAMYDATVLGAE